MNPDEIAIIACAVCRLFTDAIALRVGYENVAEVRRTLVVSSLL